MSEQLPLFRLTPYYGPTLLPRDLIMAAPTFREACRLCWMKRTRRNLMQRTVAEETGMRPSHITEYLSADPAKREMPARYIAAFEVSMGNRAITQWLAWQASLTILEQFIDTQQQVA